MRRDAKIGLAIGLGAFVGLALALTEPPEPGKLAPSPKPPTPPAPKPPDPNGQDDETALARMLVSETADQKAWPVLGWQLVTTARNRGISLFDRLTAGQGYGPRVKNGVERYADTRAKPTKAAREVARRILSGELLPARAIRELGHSSWVELQFGTESEAEQLLRKQGSPKKWGGVFARIAGTKWYLMNPKRQPIAWKRGSALAALQAVPELSPVD